MLKLFTRWFNQPSHQTDLDEFISSKNPTTVAEVDYWTREFDKKQQDFVWARGL
jgi:hypothetical protein